jgi:glycerate 2-kinase
MPRASTVPRKAHGLRTSPCSLILDVLDFEAACRGCESVVTGEGRLDASSLEGKLPVVVACKAHSIGLPVVGHFGSKGEGREQAAMLLDQIIFET